MKRPINIKIIKRKGESYFRLSYNINKTNITSAGFSNKEELAKMIKEDAFFEIEL